MQVPGLANDRNHRRLRIEQSFQARVLGRRHALAASHAEGGDLGVAQRQLADFLKVLGVFRVRQRIAAFNEVHAQLIEPLGDQQFVLEREIDAFALAAVPERGVVDIDACHDFLRGLTPAGSPFKSNGPEAGCSRAGIFADGTR